MINRFQKTLKRKGIKSAKLRRSMDRIRKVHKKYGNSIL
jgi:hypothetical protein